MTERTISRVPVATLANGHRLELTLHELRGGGKGPTLGLVAGIHGDEPLGVETMRRLLERIAAEELAGTVIALPLANAYAFQSLTRNTPLDMTNLNRVFPGDRNGVLTEQLAAVICEQLLERCDTILDLHSGGNFATVDYAYIDPHDVSLAHAFSCEVLYRAPYYAGTLTDAARAHGVTTLVAELGGGQQRNAYYLDKGIEGALSVMRMLGMLAGEPMPPAEQTVVEELTILRPHAGGVMLSAFDATHLGESIRAGSELARVIDPNTFEVLEIILAPFEPSILILTREPMTIVNPGDYGFIVGNGATATVVSSREQLAATSRGVPAAAS